jgi:opacity protein-like surface antigen
MSYNGHSVYGAIGRKLRRTLAEGMTFVVLASGALTGTAGGAYGKELPVEEERITCTSHKDDNRGEPCSNDLLLSGKFPEIPRPKIVEPVNGLSPSKTLPTSKGYGDKKRKYNLGLGFGRAYPRLGAVNKLVGGLEQQTRGLLPGADFRTWDEKDIYFFQLVGGRDITRIAGGNLSLDGELLYTSGKIRDKYSGQTIIPGVPGETSNGQKMRVGIAEANLIFDYPLVKPLELLVGGGGNYGRVKSELDYGLASPLGKISVNGKFNEGDFGGQLFGGIRVKLPKNLSLDFRGGKIFNKVKGSMDVNDSRLGGEYKLPVDHDITGPFVNVTFNWKF